MRNLQRVILSAGAMLIFSVSFQIDQMPEGEGIHLNFYIFLHSANEKWAREEIVPWDGISSAVQ